MRRLIAYQDKDIESRRQAIQADLDSAKTAAERNRMGQFATPNALAVDIARYVKSIIKGRKREIRFADPSIGSGSFYSAALTVFGAKHIKSAIGVEIDPKFAAVARDLWALRGLDIVCGDFTRFVASCSRLSAPNLILANPPYVRHHHLDRMEKYRLQQLTHMTTGVEVNGLAGFYVYFLLLSTAWMADGGTAAWLIPSEFMDVNYGAALKSFLANKVTLIRAHRFDPDDVQFGDALVSSVVLVFQKAPPVAGQAVEFTFGGTLTQPHARDIVPLECLRGARKWTVYPRHVTNDRHSLTDGSGPTLGDYFHIQRGIATGCNKFFILDRTEAKARGLPEKYLRPILPSPRYLKATIIKADGDGYPLINRQLCVIDCDLPEPIVESRYPALWKYLKIAESLGIKDGYLIGKRTLWYKQERREPTPFLCTYMGRGSHDKKPFRFIWNHSRAIGSNIYHMLYPRNSLGVMLRNHPERAESVYVLLSQITGHELRGEGRVYGGGLHKIEPSEMARISASSFVERWYELSLGAQQQGRLFR